MSEALDHKEDASGKPLPQSPAREQEPPLDTRLLSEAVIELNISRKSVGIYPPGHAQIAKSIDRSFEFLERLFEIRREMTLGVAKDTLLVGQNYFDQKNPVYRDFALSMNQRGIAAVTFVRGLDREELVRFHRVLTTKPEELTSAGGIERVMNESSTPHIRVLPIDYGGFHVTEEREIFRPRGDISSTAGADLWQDFVSQLSAGTLAGQDEGVSLKDAEQVDLSELARLLNERKLDINPAIQSYERIITTHVRDAAEQRRLTSEQSKTLARLNTLLKKLHPELRKQFLSTAFAHVTAEASRAGAEAVLGGLSDDLVVEMLTQANAEGREISPTLAGLMGKLAKAQQDPGIEAGSSATVMVPENIQKLFERERYEEYVPAEYVALLRRMAEDTPIAVEPFPIGDYERTLEDEHLDFQIGRALLAFMEEDIDPEDYREFARKLVAIVPGFLKTGNFELLWDISETLRRHEADKPSPEMRENAGEARAVFSDPDFISKALSAFELWMKDKGPEAAGLIRSLGPATIPGLMDIFSKDESYSGNRMLFNILSMFGEPAVREAEKRLRDERPYYVRNLLVFIRRAGDRSSLPHITPMLTHESPAVRIEAINTVLKFKDPEAVKHLRAAIHSHDPDFASKATRLAGHYRVADVMEDLLSNIRRVIIFETDYAENEELIRALGEIGDPRALPDIEKLARSAFSLYPRSNRRMKEAIFESLSRYPLESLAPLLKTGKRSGSEKIRTICRRLSEQT